MASRARLSERRQPAAQRSANLSECRRRARDSAAPHRVPCKACVVARKDGIARSWLYGRTISAVRGSSCDRKQQGLSCRRSSLGSTSNARRRGRSVGRQGACAGRGCAGGRVGWGGLLRGAHTHARRRTARFASHAVTKVAEGGARSQAEEARSLPLGAHPALRPRPPPLPWLAWVASPHHHAPSGREVDGALSRPSPKRNGAPNTCPDYCAFPGCSLSVREGSVRVVTPWNTRPPHHLRRVVPQP